jgi:hypothetical protein
MTNQEAIKVLNHISDHVKYDTMEDEVFISDKIYEAAETAITALEAQQSDMWIPCKERVPIVDNLVLCCVDGAVVSGYYHDGWHLGKFLVGNVTHWKWMPAPWKGEQPL